MSVVVVVRAASGGGQGEGPPTTTITTYHAGVGSPTDDTRYELGSVTKAFASLLLARAVAAGRPHAIPVATWTAGLRGVSFRTPPGTRWAYSNFGAGLLGYVVARAVGAPFFVAAIREWVFLPAGMASAAIADAGGSGDGGGAPDAAGGGGEVATPHDDGGAVPPSGFTDVTAAAAGARASAADMGAFGAFCLAAAADGRPLAAASAAAAGGGGCGVGHGRRSGDGAAPRRRHPDRCGRAGDGGVRDAAHPALREISGRITRHTPG
ncbi:hypothetical protein I4F81_012129 [Pyropia yezoensis]|uniref:Uncharacterized protein n=1 Tax=Pyropia yezoensis TaxID=2788 RepID=A0ACC3CH82_PYRYE|nr:hypothetical protein I4F81_012129 [Neopyropia yezoensis]